MKRIASLVGTGLLVAAVIVLLAGCQTLGTADVKDDAGTTLGHAMVRTAEEGGVAEETEDRDTQADADAEEGAVADEEELPEIVAAFDPVSEVSVENAPDSVSDFLAMQCCDAFSADDIPASVDPTSTQPFEALSVADIQAVYLQHPLVGSTKLTTEEVSAFVGTLQTLTTSEARAVAEMWVTYNNAYRFYVVGTNGELWLFDARCDMYSDWLPMVVMYGDKGISGFDRDAMDALGAVYDGIEARLNATMPEEVAPFANLEAEEISKAEYYSKLETHELSRRQAESLVSLATQIVINPQTGTGELPPMAGGSLSGGDASDMQFLLTFTNGSTITIGSKEGIVIGGIRYEGDYLPIYSFYQSIFK